VLTITKGVEARVGYTAQNGLYAGLSINEMRTKNKDTGKSLEFTPDRTISANIDVPLSKALKVGFLTTYIGEQEYSDVMMKKVNNKPTKVKVDKTTDAYTLVDLTASYTFGDKNQYKINGGVNNIFDEIKYHHKEKPLKTIARFSTINHILHLNLNKIFLYVFNY